MKKNKPKKSKEAYALLLPGTGEVVAIFTNKEKAKSALGKARDHVAGTRDLVLQEFPLNPTQENLLRWI